jgi:hypothetical protein
MCIVSCIIFFEVEGLTGKVIGIWQCDESDEDCMKHHEQITLQKRREYQARGEEIGKLPPIGIGHYRMPLLGVWMFSSLTNERTVNEHVTR